MAADAATRDKRPSGVTGITGDSLTGDVLFELGEPGRTEQQRTRPAWKGEGIVARALGPAHRHAGKHSRRGQAKNGDGQSGR
jgi:hypothetical protein